MALIYVAPSAGTADIRVHLVGHEGLADLNVYETESQGSARGRDEFWCFVESSGLASSRIVFESSQGGADLLIFSVSSQGQAGWRRSHRLQGRL